ncbi:hypothetical protein ARMGADRAFT_1071095 [Armillaria gallica]|uniref:Uncharacterized protein n=1 Tax=Armillaria gallica TaxID=47427 RepID=A0A2H3E262_ARMGA|nr:hypothetical protein ARMGADRAFT_1071095 [Armillaria gallica]
MASSAVYKRITSHQSSHCSSTMPICEDRTLQTSPHCQSADEACQQYALDFTFYSQIFPATDRNHKHTLRNWRTWRGEAMEEGDLQDLVIHEEILYSTPVPDTYH